MRTAIGAVVTWGVFLASAPSLVAVGPATAAATGPATAAAGAVSGTWGYTLHIEEMAVDAVATLKEEGGKVTGTVAAGADEKGLEISEGKISEHSIEFKVDRVSDAGTLRSTYRGTVEGDQIKGTVEIGWIDVPGHAGMTKIDWAAKRAKAGEHPKPGIH